jgi:DNA mismatch endonuclease (patch repair protein)
MDTVSKEKRSEIMSKIRGKDTKPEKIVRSLLHSMGYRFRLHRKDLPGKPDIVLPKYKTVIFVHGCFWHGHDCKNGKLPKTNISYWAEKIKQNKTRDENATTELERMGWKVFAVWSCETLSSERLAEKISRILR